MSNGHSTPGEYKHQKPSSGSSVTYSSGSPIKGKYGRDGGDNCLSEGAASASTGYQRDQRNTVYGDNGRPHMLSFSNRVSISLKTPSYVRTSYILFSTVKIVPAHIPSGKIIGQTVAPSSTGKSKSVTSGQSTQKSLLSGKKDVKKRGFVSSLANNFVRMSSNPWMEQGGYFVGLLGYWWTIDDGTSLSGAREKARLGNAILAVEEQDEHEESCEMSKVANGLSCQISL